MLIMFRNSYQSPPVKQIAHPPKDPKGGAQRRLGFENRKASLSFLRAIFILIEGICFSNGFIVKYFRIEGTLYSTFFIECKF
jgi:hypothetical protein